MAACSVDGYPRGHVNSWNIYFIVMKNVEYNICNIQNAAPKSFLFLQILRIIIGPIFIVSRTIL